MAPTDPDKLFDDDQLQERGDEFLFQDDDKSQKRKTSKTDDEIKEFWKVLVVDDEEDIHSVTRMALKGFTYKNKGIEFLHTYSGKESKEVLKKNPDIAVILLDVVMETNTAGLDLVKYIRDKLGYRFVQIILRTGYPGYAPEREVIVSYEINDYKTKTELTSFKLFTLILASLRAYDSVTDLEALRLNLEAKVKVRTAELEQKNLQIMEMDQMKTRFFSNISHEFRTPLTLIMGPVDEMLDSEELKGTERSKVERMHRNAQRLLSLINQLMDLSKLDAGSLKLELSEGDIVGYLKPVISGFAAYGERNEIKYNYKLPDNSDKTYFDGDKLEKICTNLLSNAFKYTDEGGKVTCKVELSEEQKKKQLKITVSDTGAGIPSGQLNKIFDRFYQVENNTATYGTGIGLSLTKELVELHKGTLNVKSQPGKGSTFIVTLPLGKDHLKESDYVVVKADTSEKKIPHTTLLEDKELPCEEPVTEDGIPLVLIVEDNPDVRDHLSEALIDQYTIVETPNGKAGLEKAVEIIPDLVITDLMMPEMDGVELCRKLKTDEHTSHIPVIMLTAKANVEDKIGGLETGADDYLTKPFNMKEVKARIRNLIEQRKNLRERFSKNIKLEPKDIAITSADELFLNRAIGIIEDHMGDFEFDSAQFQDEMAMSRSQLFRKLKALTNQSASEFIRSIRLKRGAKLMEKGFGNIAEITYEVGFNNLSYFAKCFKGLFGTSPSDYTKQFKQ